MTSPAMTMRGMILGTAAYMSPEQAAGKPVDKRSDLWAFGVVLLEMLTGRQVFTGESVSHVIASVLKSDPDWTALPADTPPTIRRLLRRCLEKDRKRRLTDAGAARLELDDALAAPAADPAAPPVTPRPSSRLAAAVPWLLLVATIAGGAAWWQSQPAPATPPVSRSLIDFPQFAMSGARLGNFLTLSPDGTRLVYVGNPDGKNRLYVRRLDQFEATAIPGTDEAIQPFFSPDGDSIGFFSGGKLKRVSLAGGAPLALADASNSFGGAWGPRDTIVFAPDRSGLFEVAAGGGQVRQLTKVSGEVTSHAWPAFAGGEAVMFTSRFGAVGARIDVVMRTTGEIRTLVDHGAGAAYADSGHLVYAHPSNGALLAAPFDPTRLDPVPEAVTVVDGVLSSVFAPQFSLARTGSLVYLPNLAAGNRTMVWVDRMGRTTPALRERLPFTPPQLSPDGGRVATSIFEGFNARHLWVFDILRGTSSRLTSSSDGLQNVASAWSPDGKQLLLHSNRAGTVNNLYRIPAGGGGSPEPLSPSDLNVVGNDWSPDGRHLVFQAPRSESGLDLWTMTLEGNRKATPFLATPSNELAANFSADSRYLAYLSDRTGRYEVYVQPFPGPGEAVQVSTDGGTEPAWSPKGDELFYRQGDKMMVVKAATAPALRLSKPQVLFEGRYEISQQIVGIRYYDVAPDGQRFIMLQGDSQTGSRQLYLVTHWFEELKAKVPSGRSPSRQ